jgi:2,4-diketo-3-deoxy-L-fuconate hydrolase
MKLLRYGELGQEKPGLLAPDGSMRSLSGICNDITPELLSQEGLRALRAIDASKLPRIEGASRLGIPVNGIRQIIAVGLNYRDHAQEANMPLPEEPLLFSKAITSLSGPNDEIVIPANAKCVDWEVELGVIIGTEAANVTEANALEYVAGYCGVNDVSERDWQLARGGQFFKGKSAQSFCPVGPWLVTKDEIPNPQCLTLKLEINGQVMQFGSTSNMVFSVAHLVCFISKHLTLRPGDLIITGTPAGVGMGQKPSRFMRVGEILVQSIEQLGTQEHKIRGTSQFV